MYLAIKNQIFNCHSMPKSVRKMFRRIVVSLGIRSSKMSENFRLDRNNIGFQNMFYTKCINVIIDIVI